jgi:hypothetical protein
VSILVSVRFEIPCVSLHFAALHLMAKPLFLQDNATRCAQVRRSRMRLRVSCSVVIAEIFRERKAVAVFVSCSF